ncbi:MAG: hypothetical protein QMD53_07190 [Actinomycetota bacterium]|nr:hypothetical protein [Actinomycetota bacterium]
MAPKILKNLGRPPKKRAERSGVKTTKAPVMKPALPEVISFSPRV